METELKFLALLLIANGAPILARNLMGNCCSWPLDGGMRTAAGAPILGDSKTLRGVISAILLTGAVAPIGGIDWLWGTTIGALAMLGDLLASFTKRRLGYPPSSRTTGLDQIPESLLPVLVVAPVFKLGWSSIIIILVGFIILVPLLSFFFYYIGIRRRPY
jgi:CDP-diglyceride synthetase